MESKNNHQSKACLLILPEPPADISLSSFRNAYSQGLQTVFSQLIQWAEKGPVALDICLLCNLVNLSRDAPRTSSFIYIQSLLKQLYSLLAVSLVEQSLELLDDRLDVRIYVLDAYNHGKLDQILHNQGPILTLDAVSQSSRQWTEVFTMTGRAGEDLLQAFTRKRKLRPGAINQPLNIHRLPGGMDVQTHHPDSNKSPDDHDQGKQSYHYSIAVGGTFDHLHLGHKLLLTATALALDPPHTSSDASSSLGSDKPRVLTIGITTTALLLNKAHASVLESWSNREQSVIKFMTSILDLSISSPAELTSERFDKDENYGTAIHYKFPDGLVVRCVEIEDGYGPTITDKDIDALVVSAETRKGGAAVNEKRREKGWHELDVFEVDVLDANPSEESTEAEQDFKSKISSTEIRKRIAERLQQSENQTTIT